MIKYKKELKVISSGGDNREFRRAMVQTLKDELNLKLNKNRKPDKTINTDDE